MSTTPTTFDIESVLEDWSMRFPGGRYDETDVNKISYLIEALSSMNYSSEFITEMVHNLVGEESMIEPTELPNSEDSNVLDETYPAVDPRDDEVRYFHRMDNYELALHGEHPDHPGIIFIKISPEELEKRKAWHENRARMVNRKKHIVIEFLRLMKAFIKASPEKRAQVSEAIITRFKIFRNDLNTKIYVSGGFANWEKYLGISGADIIKMFADTGSPIPLKKRRVLPTKYFTKGDKRTSVAKLDKVEKPEDNY